jgi:hypothetical protein
MNNFTKEYIAECDCEEIQGLRPKLEHGDWYYHINEIYLIRNGYSEFFNRVVRKNTTWLPTGDQLDEEIVKICKENDYEYTCEYFNWIGKDYYDWHLVIWGEPDEDEARDKLIELEDSNPLIAKIRLLKHLLREQS